MERRILPALQNPVSRYISTVMFKLVIYYIKRKMLRLLIAQETNLTWGNNKGITFN